MKEASNKDLLNRLYPMHIVFGKDGIIHSLSKQAEALFPGAKNILDVLAPNSAAELTDLVVELNKTSTEQGIIDVFSIQQYATWLGKVTKLDNDGAWLLGMETLTRERLTEASPEDLSSQEIQELQHKIIFYEALLQQLPAELAVFDPEFKFLFVNRHAIKNDELRKWLIGRKEIEYWKSKNLPLDKTLQRIEAFKKAVAERKSTAVEEIFHAGTEREKHYVRITHPYFKEEELQFLLSYGIDITELKQTENKLIRQNAELEKVNAELDQFVYSASHNLRAPLLSMKGLLSLISMEDTAVVERNRFLHEVYRSIDRLDATIHDIIEYSKNARLAIAPEEIDILNIVHTTIDDLKFFDQAKVNINVDAQLNSAFYSDARRIRSVVHNLMSNSIKYADPSKSERFLAVKVMTTPTECIMTFADNGIGIAAENQKRVFEMFYRATSERPGSGLGLYIVKEMIHKLGGEVHLDSAKDVGTTIRIAIPNLASEKIES
jgi:signal transduction histidine kinase